VADLGSLLIAGASGAAISAATSLLVTWRTERSAKAARADDALESEKQRNFTGVEAEKVREAAMAEADKARLAASYRDVMDRADRLSYKLVVLGQSLRDESKLGSNPTPEEKIGRYEWWGTEQSALSEARVRVRMEGSPEAVSVTDRIWKQCGALYKIATNLEDELVDQDWMKQFTTVVEGGLHESLAELSRLARSELGHTVIDVPERRFESTTTPSVAPIDPEVPSGG